MVRELDPNVAMSAFGGLGTLARDELLRERMLAGLSLVFASLAGLLAAMGLAGLTSVNVTRRTREIGIRLALGASRGSVERLVLREVALLVGAGIAVGVALFLSVNRVLRSVLFEISPGDPVTIGLAIAALAGIGVLAGVLPAHRAARVDPAVIAEVRVRISRTQRQPSERVADAATLAATKLGREGLQCGQGIRNGP
jgi:ABC-type antimicrobial peptide transport system permease subunit